VQSYSPPAVIVVVVRKEVDSTKYGPSGRCVVSDGVKKFAQQGVLDVHTKDVGIGLNVVDDFVHIHKLNERVLESKVATPRNQKVV
jgi:hypothetical protein